MDIAAILPVTPAAMAPAFELCPPIGISMAELKEEPWETLLTEYDCELEI